MSNTLGISASASQSIAIPLIRRTFPELITNEIVGVQPMSSPTGLSFALRYSFATEESSVQVRAYESEEQYEYTKSSDWNVNMCEVFGVENKDGDIYVMWDHTENKMMGKTLSRDEFEEMFFTEAI